MLQCTIREPLCHAAVDIGMLVLLMCSAVEMLFPSLASSPASSPAAAAAPGPTPLWAVLLVLVDDHRIQQVPVQDQLDVPDYG